MHLFGAGRSETENSRTIALRSRVLSKLAEALLAWITFPDDC